MHNSLLNDDFPVRLLDNLPGAVTYLTAVYNSFQELIDFRFAYSNTESASVAGTHYQPVEATYLRSDSSPDATFNQALFEQYAQTFRTDEAWDATLYVSSVNRSFHIWCKKVANGILSTIQEKDPTAASAPQVADMGSSANELQAVVNEAQAGISLYRPIRDGIGQIEDFELVATSPTNQAILTRFYPVTSRQELIGQRISSFFPTIKRLGFFDQLVNTVQTGQPQRYEWRPHWDNADFCFEVIVTSWEEGIALSFLDVTNHKRAEAKLREEHRRLAQAQALTHIGSFERLLTSHRIEWSDEMYRIHGLEPQSEEITQEKVLGLVHPEDQAAFHKCFQLSIEEQTGFELTHRIIRPDGSVRVIKKRCEFLTNEVGVVDRLYGTGQDITDQMTADEDRKRQAHFIQQITDTLPGTISVYDFEKKGLVYINHQRFTHLGYNQQELDELDGLRWIERIIHPDDQEKVQQHMAKLAVSTNDQVHSLDYRIRNKSGEWEWRRSRAKIFQRDADGQPLQYISLSANITKEKEAEAEIRRAQELLQAVFRTVPVSITVFEAIRNEQNQIIDFRCTLSNGVVEQRIHVDVVGQTVCTLLPGHANHENFHLMVRTAETGEPAELTFQFVFGSQSIWLHGQYNKLGDSVVISYEEITQRKEAEEQLQAQAARLQSTFNGVPASITLMEAVREPGRAGKPDKVIDFTATAFNQQALELVGCSAEDLRSKTMLQTSPEAKNLGLFDDYVQVYQTGKPTYREITLPRQELVRYYAFYVTPQVDGHGVVVTALDISNLKETEKKARYTAESLQAVMDSSPAAIGLLKAVRNGTPTDTEPKGEIEDFYVAAANQKFAQQFYRPLHLITGRRVSKLTDFGRYGNLLKEWKQVVTTDKSVYRERQVKINGFNRWIGESIRKEDDGLILTALDITDLKVAKEQEDYWFKQLQEYNETSEALTQLRQILQQRNELLRATSHDLRGSFGVIQGAATLMTMMDTDDDRTQMLSVLQRNLRQVTQVLTQLLDFSRLEAGLEELKTGGFDAADLLQELSDSIGVIANEKNLSVQTEGPKQLLVDGDIVKVRRIAQNLVLNAIKYTQSGSITIHWGDASESGEWWFTVRDTGPGLSATLLKSLTSPSVETVSSSADGEGIGLAIVKRLAQLLKVRLVVESEPGVGTLFRLTLPQRYGAS